MTKTQIKTNLTKEQVKKITKLASLHLSPEEEKKLLPQLRAILDFVSQLNQIPTEAVEPTSQVTGLTNVFREDVIDTSRMLTQKQALANAPASHNGLVKVKAIFAE